MKQRGNRRRGRAFDHQLAMRHDPDHGVENIFVRQRYNVVHKALHNGERSFTYALHAQTVNDAIDLIERDHVSGFHTLLHSRSVGRFDTDDLDLRIAGFQRHGNTGDQAATTNPDNRDIDLANIRKNLQTELALSADELYIVK